MEKNKEAVELFKQGYSCAQAVAGAFSEEMGISQEKATALSACFGAGICGTRQICGAVSGGLMALGLIKNYASAEQKATAYTEGKKLIEDFEKEFGTTVCFDLLTTAKVKFAATPMARDEEYYKVRPCAVYVAYVAEWLEEYLKKTPVTE